MLITEAPFGASKGQQPLGQEEHRRHVEGKGLLVLFRGDAVERHQNATPALLTRISSARPEPLTCSTTVSIPAPVARSADIVSTAASPSFVRAASKLAGIAADQADFGAFAQERLGDRKADPLRPTRHQGPFSLQVSLRISRSAIWPRPYGMMTQTLLPSPARPRRFPRRHIAVQHTAHWPVLPSEMRRE